GAITVSDVTLPLIFNLSAMGLGAVFALLLSRMLPPSRSRDNRLILALAMLLALAGLCAAVDVSPLLSCMVFGAVYVNRTGDKKLFKQLNKFTPPIMMLFFVVSGMKLDLSVLSAFGLVGVVYFLVRIAGKYIGAYVGCLLTRQERRTRVYLGAALVPQAGVAIGLAHLAERMLPDAIGSLLVTIILASSVLYELIGPACAKIALFRSGAISRAPAAAAPADAEPQAEAAREIEKAP
ncbi:MAG: cation:proton antiporter, partial [Clostridiales bacterium]|nr:cation:proton antiporter [Clostridiales bacterium]